MDKDQKCSIAIVELDAGIGPKFAEMFDGHVMEGGVLRVEI